MTLAEQGIITGLKPVGGWRYPHPYAGQIIVILPGHAPKGHYPNHGEKLVAAVKLFRSSRGIAPGEPERDIAEFIRRASPQNDYYRGKVPDSIGKPRVRELVPMIQQLREWIEEMILRKPRLVTSPEATDRAEVCARCPQNIRWQTTCGECNLEVERRALMLRGEASFDFDPALLACRLHKIPLQAGVFLDQDFLPERSDKAPTDCWIP